MQEEERQKISELVKSDLTKIKWKEEIRKITEIIKNLNFTTACFSGHRSFKLPWGNNEEDIRYKKVKIRLEKIVEKTIHEHYDTFLCGMALGFDTMAAETVLSLKKKYPYMKLVGVLPCKNQDLKWSNRDKLRYRELLGQLDETRCLYDTYCGVKCMIDRDRYMVNNSSLLIALYDGIPGGTRATIEYAEKQGLEIKIIKP